jgi:hypothetical protein
MPAGTEAGMDCKTRRAGFTGTRRMSLKKLLDFFDPDMLQLFDFELRPYRSNGSI